ncbi:MAG TPA: creatininase family protein [Candidatus Udaeobacter sp.]|nr:creatininase family protein [Candidatus Udaeobacter sp.]
MSSCVFLYQLRAFANAGFRVVIAVTGHGEGNEKDLHRVGVIFERETGIRVVVVSDPELVTSMLEGDHAGKYEISQLLCLRPDLVDFAQVSREENPGAGGKLAIGDDAREATAELGEKIMQTCLRTIVSEARRLVTLLPQNHQDNLPKLDYEFVENLWTGLWSERGMWVTSMPRTGQSAVSAASRWLPYEYPYRETTPNGLRNAAFIPSPST